MIPLWCANAAVIAFDPLSLPPMHWIVIASHRQQLRRFFDHDVLTLNRQVLPAERADPGSRMATQRKPPRLQAAQKCGADGGGRTDDHRHRVGGNRRGNIKSPPVDNQEIGRHSRSMQFPAGRVADLIAWALLTGWRASPAEWSLYWDHSG